MFQKGRQGRKFAATLLAVFLLVSLLPGLTGTAATAFAQSSLDPYGDGVWLTGDHHMHTTASDGSESVAYDAFYADKYGLDFIAITNHGGTDNYPKIEAEYKEITEERAKYPDLLIFQGFEWNVPAAEHATFIVEPNENELQQVLDFMSLYDANYNETANTEEAAVEALKYAEQMDPKPLVLLNHPSRKGKYSIDEIRQYDSAGTVAVGFEGAPGHQANPIRGSYPAEEPGSSRAYGGYDKMTAEINGLWDTLLDEGRRWFITANSDFHLHYSAGGDDMWPGEYSKTYLFAEEKDYEDIMDGLRNGSFFTVQGDLIDALELTADNGSKTVGLGDALLAAEGDAVTVTIKVRDPQSLNNHGDNPALQQVQLISNATGTPEINKVFTAEDWQEEDGYLVMEHTFANVTSDFYVRVRGSNTAELYPAEDPEGEQAWEDLWFYSNPIFIQKVASLTPKSGAFDDIANHWAKNEIELMAGLGVAEGTNNKFNPDNPVKRAEFVTFLVRSLGLKASTAEISFTDVNPDAWYYDAVKTAYANGLVTGSDGLFRPNDPITRQEIAVMLSRALANEGEEVKIDDTEKVLNSFADGAAVSSWAESAVASMVEAEIIGGKGDSLLPADNASRAEAIAMLKRLLTYLNRL